jgi:hypothetical protein
MQADLREILEFKQRPEAGIPRNSSRRRANTQGHRAGKAVHPSRQPRGLPYQLFVIIA